MKKTKKRETIKLTPEEMEILRQRNEQQRIRNNLIKKRREELDFSNGILADSYDISRIKRLEFWRKILNLVGENLQKIMDILNKRFIKEKNDFWYGHIYKKYGIPKEIPMTYQEQDKGEYRIIIPRENENQ